MGGIWFSQNGVRARVKAERKRGKGGRWWRLQGQEAVSSLGWDTGNPALSFPRCFLEIREPLSCSCPSNILP